MSFFTSLISNNTSNATAPTKSSVMDNSAQRETPHTEQTTPQREPIVLDLPMPQSIAPIWHEQNLLAWSAQQVEDHFVQCAFYNSAQVCFMQTLFAHLQQSVVHEPKIASFLHFLCANPWSFWGKSDINPHMTCSTFLLNKEGTHVLLTHHKKLKKWLQLGGHWADQEGEQTEGFVHTPPLVAALKEMYEEGFNHYEKDVNLLTARSDHLVLLEGLVFDADIHSVGSHLHYDLCYLVRMQTDLPIQITHESMDLRWCPLDNIPQPSDARVLRMATRCINHPYLLD